MVVGDIFQPTHLLFVLVVALLVLGPKRLPEVGRSLGRTMRDFRAAVSGEETHEPTITETASTVPAPLPEPPGDLAPADAATPSEPGSESAEPTVGEATEPAAAAREPTAAP